MSEPFARHAEAPHCVDRHAGSADERGDLKRSLSCDESEANELEKKHRCAESLVGQQPHTCNVGPVRQIFTAADLDAFQRSSAFFKLTSFVLDLSNSVCGVKSSTQLFESPTVVRCCELLNQLQLQIKQVPPASTASRFGNSAFRTWLQQIEQIVTDAMASLGITQELSTHLSAFLLNSFGNAQRIDYGTGHELHYCIWMYYLVECGLMKKEDFPALVLRLYQRYLDLMRALQQTYWLEPAGSHGVWGLDDYHFLPFLFGSSQLIEHKHIKPKAVLYKEYYEGFANDYMYLACIKFVNEVKTESLQWHSPMLYDISSVKTWKKVNEGLTKMYTKEVLGKLPIMQHCLFGPLLPFKGVSGVSDPSVLVAEFATCCVQHLPSAIAAKQQAEQHRHLLPFD